MICRICVNDVENCFGLFDDKGIVLNAAKIISEHFWFEPKIDDPFSKNICEKCWEYVNNFHIFYILVQDAHEKLTIIRSNSSEEKSTVKNDVGKEDTSEINYFNYIKVKNEVQTRNSKELSIEKNEISEQSSEIKFQKPRRSERNKTLHFVKIGTDNTDIKIKHMYPTASSETLDFSQGKTENHENFVSNKNSKRNFRSSLRKRIDNKEKIENFSPKKKYVFFTDEEVAKIRTLNCNNCTKKIATFSDLKKHMDETHGENGYAVCCDKKFYKRYKFVNHLQMHLNPEEFKCPHCEKRLGSKKYIKLHIKNIHTEIGKMKKFNCDQCDKTFAQKAYLERHKLGHIPDSEKHFACDSCGNRFPTAALLRVHTLNVHESRHSAICDLCGKKYKSPADLKRHRLEHLGIHEPKVQCEICGDWLSNKYKLKRHMLKHTTADVEHRCTICNKVSANLLALKSHMRLHIAIRKFQCSICDKGFRRSLNLKEHMTTHTGETLYSCPNCPRTFTHHSNLHHHRKKMHPKELEEDRKLKHSKIEKYNKIYGKNIDTIKSETNQISFDNMMVSNELIENSINQLSSLGDF